VSAQRRRAAEISEKFASILAKTAFTDKIREIFSLVFEKSAQFGGFRKK
jgi:hypothetical protein